MGVLESTFDERTQSDWRSGLPTLANDRVVLRELRESDAAVLHGIAHAPEVARHTWPPPATIDALAQFIQWTRAERASGRYVAFGIVPRGATEVGGLFELRQLQPGFFRAEFGFLMSPTLWGTGLFSDAIQLLLGFATDVIGIHRIEARASVDNARSNAALQKLGACKEGVLRAAFVCEGQFVDQNLWALVAGLDHGSQPGRRTRRSTMSPPQR
jgi:ribosomal-protein-alanine N-acetyltransferase